MSLVEKMPPLQRSACGTHSGWVAHQRADERPCDPCREARNVYQAQWARDGGKVVVVELCGSEAGAARHRRRGEHVDEACRAAEADARAARRAERAAVREALAVADVPAVELLLTEDEARLVGEAIAWRRRMLQSTAGAHVAHAGRRASVLAKVEQRLGDALGLLA